VKVVLFCGGFGMRMREYSEALPKPMVAIGYRPILWHVMKYYAHYGHKDFILCLGYKADVIKKYFLDYDECVSNDFVLSRGGKNVELLSSDIHDWNITFVDTGLTSNIGQRLKAVQRQLEGEEMFLANYTDGLSDVPLPAVIESFKDSGNIACFVGVKPRASFHGVWRPGNEHRAHRKIRGADERRVHGVAPGDLRLHEVRRGTGGRTVSTADRRRPTDGLSTRRLLGLHGYLQGKAGS